MKPSFLIAMLSFYFAGAQEIPTYSSLQWVQYDLQANLIDRDTAHLKPLNRYSITHRRIPLLFREEFEKYVLKREVFNEKIDDDSITVEIKYEKFNRDAHKIDYEHQRIDGERVFGHFRFDEKSFERVTMRYVLKSVLVKSNGDTVAVIPNVKPFLFYSSVGARSPDLGVAVEKSLDNDFFHIDIVGGASAGPYSAVILFNTSGNVFYYLTDYVTLRPIGRDFFGATPVQYLIRHQTTLNAFELLHTLGWSDMGRYSTASARKNMGQAGAVNLSAIIQSDSLGFGEAGSTEGESFFMYVKEVRKDKKDPFLYHVKGVNARDSIVRHFEGELRLKYLLPGALYQTNITGEFFFREIPHGEGSGEYSGAFRIMVIGNGNNLLQQMEDNPEVETYYTGTLKSYGTNKISVFTCGNSPPNWIHPTMNQWWKR